MMISASKGSPSRRQFDRDGRALSFELFLHPNGAAVRSRLPHQKKAPSCAAVPRQDCLLRKKRIVPLVDTPPECCSQAGNAVNDASFPSMLKLDLH